MIIISDSMKFNNFISIENNDGTKKKQNLYCLINHVITLNIIND